MLDVRKLAGVVLGLASLGGLATVLVSWVTSHDGGLVMDPPAYRVDGESLQEFDLSMKLRNRSGRPVRLLGAHETCGLEGCAAITNLPITMPAGGETVIHVHFKAGVPGEFTKDTPIFTDSLTQPKVVVRLVGRVTGQAPSVSQPASTAAQRTPAASGGPT